MIIALVGNRGHSMNAISHVMNRVYTWEIAIIDRRVALSIHICTWTEEISHLVSSSSAIYDIIVTWDYSGDKEIAWLC